MPDNGRGSCRQTNPAAVSYGRMGREQAAGSAVRQRRAVEARHKDQDWHLTEAYVDTGPRTTLWAGRPKAKALQRDCAPRRPATTVIATGGPAHVSGIDEPGPAILLLAHHGAQLWAPAFGGAADVTRARPRYIAEILSGIAPTALARRRLATLRRRSGGNGHQRRSQSQQRRTAQ